MRKLLCPTLCALALASAGEAQEPAANEEIVKAVRAALSAKTAEERDQLVAELEARPNLDWASVRKGLEAGPYYLDPMVTEFGERHSHRHLDLRWRGSDGRERAFSFYLPKSYKADTPIPVLLYLHHASANTRYESLMGATAMREFRDAAEERGFLFLAPSTNRGAEWWTPDAQTFLQWTIEEMKRRYNLDENRIALMGAMDGGDGAVFLAQERPDLWSCVMPMSAHPAEIAAVVRPLYLGTIDRLPFLIGVPGALDTYAGNRNPAQFGHALKPFYDKGVSVTLAVHPGANNDFRYVEKVVPVAAAWAVTHKRDPYAVEVDIEADGAQRSYWLECHGPDPDGPETSHLPSTRYLGFDLKQKDADAEPPAPKLGVNLHERKEWPLGVVITQVSGAAQDDARLRVGDILLAVNGVDIRTAEDLKKVMAQVAYGDEVHVLAAREVPEAEAEALRKYQDLFLKRRAERLAREAETGKKERIRDDYPLEEDLEEDDGDEEEEEGTTIEWNDPGDAEQQKQAVERGPTTFVFLERWARPEAPVGPLVRGDFGLRQDRNHDKEGVKLGYVTPGSLAARSGFKEGDVIVAVGSETVRGIRDVEKFFKDFDFTGRLEFTVMRGSGEETVIVRWEEKPYGRVDARWDKQDKILRVWARKVAGFTLYFTDELIPPGEPYHLFINDIPYKDLVDPESTPDYPRALPGDLYLQDEIERMKRARAKVDGWTPDPRWALRDGIARRDRRLVLGGKWSIDLKALAPGFAAEKARREERERERGRRLAEAREGHGG